MDDALRLRLDIGLVLLAITAASTAVAASGLTDAATVATAVLALLVLLGVVLFLRTTPEWAREGGTEAGDTD
ncbi:hypothetical protein [Haloglomus litoreum]|uniref:hypothetical protein n=1 Tax=Haloglomus litoreum TaxID=3034026 RepID=UPI0023E78A4D|nr:hypothetical protein [Haloglomus sp. DT116]